jgi:HEXXH motif-containing protein
MSGALHVPWRVDPWPFDGLLQGAYAYLAVTVYWSVADKDAYTHVAGDMPDNY